MNIYNISFCIKQCFLSKIVKHVANTHNTTLFFITRVSLPKIVYYLLKTLKLVINMFHKFKKYIHPPRKYISLYLQLCSTALQLYSFLSIRHNIFPDTPQLHTTKYHKTRNIKICTYIQISQKKKKI